MICGRNSPSIRLHMSNTALPGPTAWTKSATIASFNGLLQVQGAQGSPSSSMDQGGPLHPTPHHQQVALCHSRHQTLAARFYSDTAALCGTPSVENLLLLERCNKASNLLLSGPQQGVEQVCVFSCAKLWLSAYILTQMLCCRILRFCCSLLWSLSS